MAHAWDLRVEVDDDEWVSRIKTDFSTADLSERDRALCDHAIKLTREPWTVTRGDVERLRSLGFDDRSIHDATQTVAYFNYINRVADGLGVDLEEGM